MGQWQRDLEVAKAKGKRNGNTHIGFSKWGALDLMIIEPWICVALEYLTAQDWGQSTLNLRLTHRCDSGNCFGLRDGSVGQFHGSSVCLCGPNNVGAVGGSFLRTFWELQGSNNKLSVSLRLSLLSDSFHFSFFWFFDVISKCEWLGIRIRIRKTIMPVVWNLFQTKNKGVLVKM